MLDYHRMVFLKQSIRRKHENLIEMNISIASFMILDHSILGSAENFSVSSGKYINSKHTNKKTLLYINIIDAKH